MPLHRWVRCSMRLRTCHPRPGCSSPPVPLELAAPGLELEPDPGAPGVAVVVEEDEDDPPGMTTVSFSFVVEAEGLAPPGTTVVVSLLSHA